MDNKDKIVELVLNPSLVTEHPFPVAPLKIVSLVKCYFVSSRTKKSKHSASFEVDDGLQKIFIFQHIPYH